MFRYIRLLQKQDRLKEQIERLESNLYFVHPSTLTDMPRGSLRGTDGVTDDLCRLGELREELKEVKEKLESFRQKFGITDKEELVACYREVFNASWKETADALGCSTRHAMRIYNNLMEKFL